MRSVLLAAEGMAEIEGQDWVRDATESEIQAFKDRHEINDDAYRNLIVDKTGRPFWLVTILDHAPELAKQKAESFGRVRTLLEQ